MTAVKGYVRGNVVVAEDFIAPEFDGKDVVITILDSSHAFSEKCENKKQYTDTDIEGAFGMWSDHAEKENIKQNFLSDRKHFSKTKPMELN